MIVGALLLGATTRLSPPAVALHRPMVTIGQCLQLAPSTKKEEKNSEHFHLERLILTRHQRSAQG